MDNFTEKWTGDYEYEYGDYEDSGQDGVRQEITHIIAVVVYSLSCVLGLIGNGLVIWVLTCKIKLSVSTLWLLNLAAADFVFVLFLPFSIDYVVRDFHWIFGMFLCKVNSYVLAINMYASVLFISVLSVDRYICLVHINWSRKYHTKAWARAVCVAVWSCAAIFSIPALVFRDTMKLHNKVVCYNNFSDDHHVAMALHVTIVAFRTTVGFLLPFSATTVTGLLLAAKVRSSGGVRVSSLTRTILAVILAFFLCWAPFHIFSLMEVTMHVSFWLATVLRVGFPLASSLAFFNSCVNPLLYVLLNRNVRRILKQSLLNITKRSVRGLIQSISASEPASALNSATTHAMEMTM